MIHKAFGEQKDFFSVRKPLTWHALKFFALLVVPGFGWCCPPGPRSHCWQSGTGTTGWDQEGKGGAGGCVAVCSTQLGLLAPCGAGAMLLGACAGRCVAALCIAWHTSCPGLCCLVLYWRGCGILALWMILLGQWQLRQQVRVTCCLPCFASFSSLSFH